MKWEGVMPAVTTPFTETLEVDYPFLQKHARWLVDAGCTAIVPLGSLGEGATLSLSEKEQILKALVEAVKGKVPIIPGISSLSTPEAVNLARRSEEIGCRGLMVLPPYVYSTDWREMKAHVAAVIAATTLPCMLYNNPVAYTTDFLPAQIKELADEHSNLESVKESSTDVRRITGIRAVVGDRLQISAGVDDVVVEAVAMGATGWIAGLVNAFPAESVALFNYARDGKQEKALALYRWFLPLLRLDTVPKFVQLIKLVQEVVGMGSVRVRPPRLHLVGEELQSARQVIDQAMKARPVL
jgi:dihydrodipicolinate synthase/N-acetylneuraminate lyase